MLFVRFPHFILGIIFFCSKSVDLTDLTKKYNQLMSSVAEEKESLENFQKQCEGDVKSLRNLTLDVINSIKGLRI